MTFHHGVRATESSSGIIPIKTAPTAIIGLIATAADADPMAYPVNTPVLVTSMTRALKSAGVTGTLRRALEAIAAITSPTIIVVRVDLPANPTSLSDYTPAIVTAINTLLTSKSVVGETAKILVAPELESPDVVQALISVAKKRRAMCYVTPRDSNFDILPTKEAVVAYRDTLGAREVCLVWPEFLSGNVLLPAMPSGAGLSSMTLYAEDRGSVHDLQPDIGDTLTVTVNGVATQSAAFNGGSAQSWVLQALIGAGLDTSTFTSGDIAYNFQITAPVTGSQVISIVPTSSDRVIFRASADGQSSGAGTSIDPNINQLNPVSFTLSGTNSDDANYGAGVLNAVSVVAGLRALLDETVGWHKSISNVAVTGPTGISEALTWDLEDPDTDVGYLNSHDITTLIQHLGFRFWGNHTCSDDPNFMFEVATRTAHVLLDTIVNGVFPFIDKPLTVILARDIIDSINAKLRELVKAQRLIGAKCWYDPEADGNSTQALQMGQFFIEYDYTPVPTLELLGLNQHITSRYLVDFAKLG
jgi:phage tail sheath protein FI